MCGLGSAAGGTDSCAATDARRRFIAAPDGPAVRSPSDGSVLFEDDILWFRMAGEEEAPKGDGRGWPCCCNDASGTGGKYDDDDGSVLSPVGERDLGALYDRCDGGCDGSRNELGAGEWKNDLDDDLLALKPYVYDCCALRWSPFPGRLGQLVFGPAGPASRPLFSASVVPKEGSRDIRSLVALEWTYHRLLRLHVPDSNRPVV